MTNIVVWNKAKNQFKKFKLRKIKNQRDLSWQLFLLPIGRVLTLQGSISGPPILRIYYYNQEIIEESADLTSEQSLKLGDPYFE